MQDVKPVSPAKAPAMAPTVNTSALPHETEMERKARLLSKVRVMRDSLIQSQAQIEGKDPAKVYTWVNRHESRLVIYEGMGYTICRDPKVKTQWRKEDGSHVRGDVILMECPLEMHEAWQTLAEISAVEAMDSGRNQFKEFAGSHNVPVYEPRT